MRISNRFPPFALLTILSVACPLLAAFPSFAADQWSLMNGPYGGDIMALGADGAGKIYAARGDDIFRSGDEGDTWTNISDGGVGANINCLHVAPSGDLYAGVSSRGVWWSFNGGQSWDHDQITHDPHGGLGATIIAITVSSNDIIFAGSFRSLDHGGTWLDIGFYGYAFAYDSADNLYAGSYAGVRFSSDGGASWSLLNAGMENETVDALALDSSDRIYAGTRANGVFLSADGGTTWNIVNNGLPSQGIEALAIDSGDRVYAALADGGLYMSDDTGSNWNAVENGLTDRRILSLFAGEAGKLYAGSAAHGVFRSSDLGANWSSKANAEMPLPQLQDVSISPATGHLIVAADGGGLHRSVDGGEQWEERNSGLATTRVHAVAANSAGRLYAGTEDGVYASDDEGADWVPANTGHEGTAVVGLLIDSEDNVLAFTDPGAFFAFSLLRSEDDGQTWTVILDENLPSLPLAIGGWTLDSEDRIYVGGQLLSSEGAVLVSDDAGDSWNETVVGFLGVTGVAVNSSDHVYATLGENTVYKSIDHAGSFSSLPTGGWPQLGVGLLNGVEVDGQDGVVVSVKGDDIYRSPDGGNSWETYGDGFANGSTANFLSRENGVFFAGTAYDGLFRNDGNATSVGSAVPTAVRARLMPNRPNPFNPTTEIRFSVARRGEADLSVFDVAGRLVATLVEERLDAGEHAVSWDGRMATGNAAVSGTYFVRLSSAGEVTTRKILLVR